MTKVYGVQWDSATDAIPHGVALRALYANGSAGGQLAKYGYGRGRVYIDVNGTAPTKAFWRDIEPGDGSPEGFGHWLDQRHQAGHGWGGGYCDRADLDAMIKSAGKRPWSLWLSTLDGTVFPAELLHLPPNVTPVAVQAFGAAHLGINADLSVIINEQYWQAHAALP